MQMGQLAKINNVNKYRINNIIFLVLTIIFVILILFFAVLKVPEKRLFIETFSRSSLLDNPKSTNILKSNGRNYLKIKSLDDIENISIKIADDDLKVYQSINSLNLSKNESKEIDLMSNLKIRKYHIYIYKDLKIEEQIDKFDNTNDIRNKALMEYIFEVK